MFRFRHRTVADPAMTENLEQIELLLSATVPTGSLLPYAGTTAPEEWLLCDGSAVSRTTYSRLFAVLSATYGAGDGSTTFNLPDLRGRVPVGVDGAAGRLAANNTLGASSGTETHTLTAAESGLPAHTHFAAMGTGASTANINDFAARHTSASSDSGAFVNPVQGVQGGAQAASAAHNIMQPYQVVNYIVKA